MLNSGGDESRTELDSHADSAVVGRNALILSGPQKTVSVSGFTKSLGLRKSIPVVNAAVLHTCDMTGKMTVLLLHNALHFEEMESNLIPPFLMREAGLIVDECPKFQAIKPTLRHHSIYCPESKLLMPFNLRGIISYLPTRLPTSEEVREHRGKRTIHLTPNSPDWNPNVAIYKDQESSMLDYNGDLVTRNLVPRRVCAVSPLELIRQGRGNTCASSHARPSTCHATFRGECRGTFRGAAFRGAAFRGVPQRRGISCLHWSIQDPHSRYFCSRSDG